MEQDLAAKLKENLSVKVFRYSAGWQPVPASVKGGVIEIDLSQNTDDADYNVEITFLERFREIGSGSTLFRGVWVPIAHEVGLDTRWQTAFKGKSLLEAVRFTTREGEHILIPVQYVGVKSREETKPDPFTIAVRADRQLINVMWRGVAAGAHSVLVEVKAVEPDGEYEVEALRLPLTKSYVAIDKLAADKYSVQVFACDAANAALAKSRVVLVDLPR